MTCSTPKETMTLMGLFPALTYSLLGRTGFYVSQAGVGTYRMLRGVSEHEEALQFALEMGINLIDTSSNYGDGDAEKLIGDMLQEHFAAGKTRREQLVLVSKAGYVQGQTWSQFQGQKDSGQQWPEVLELEQGLAYCMHPAFLAKQLSLSLARLQEPILDIFLVHNPEYTLKWALASGMSLAAARELFYERLRTTFVYLETEVEKGRIQHYGISSNTFGAPSDSDLFVSLDRVMSVVKTLGENSHFSVVQCPMNLLETGAVTCLNQPNNQSFLEVAMAHNLGVLINRPFNAIGGHGALQRLVDYDVEEPIDEANIEESLHEVKRMESLFKSTLLEKVRVEDDRQLTLFKQVMFQGESLKSAWNQFKSYAHWREALALVLWPNLELGIQLLTVQEQPEAVMQWIEAYLMEFNTLSHLLSLFYKERSTHEGDVIRAAVRDCDPVWGDATSLSHTALRALRSTEGIHCVLVGMRHLVYVEDVLSELAQSVAITDKTTSWTLLENKLSSPIS